MEPKKGRQRLDRLVVERGLADSRERARALILAGSVTVDGEPASKAGALVPENAPITLREADHPYVSRGGLKLAGALESFGLDVTGFMALDAGASTGGFTDCLLQKGARKVYAVDVGYGQFAWKLRRDERVVLLERTNIRHVTGDLIKEAVDLAVIDVSFISLRLVIPAVLPFLRAGGWLLPLIKPQFEAGRDQVGKRGVVRDPAVHRDVIEKVSAFVGEQGFRVIGTCDSPLTGPEGNREFFLLGKKEKEEPAPGNQGARF